MIAFVQRSSCEEYYDISFTAEDRYTPFLLRLRCLWSNK